MERIINGEQCCAIDKFRVTDRGGGSLDRVDKGIGLG